MASGKQYIPTKDDDYYTFQGNLVNIVVTNTAAWGIPPSAVMALTTRRAEYEPLYLKCQNKGTRTKTDVLNHRQMRATYEAEIRTFVRKYGDFIPDSGKSDIGLTIRDLEPTPRGKIDGKPYIDLESVGGGSITVRTRVTTDRTRASMHQLADAIECRYTFVPVGDMPPENWDDCPKTAVSKKALFKIQCGAKAIGQRFYGFFRWVNQSIPANSGDWTNALTVVIA